MTARKPPAKRASAARKPATRASATRKAAAPRKPATRGGSSRPSQRGPFKRLRRGLRRITSGDRPFMMGLLLLAVVLLSMAWAPIKNLTAGSERIEQLTASRDQLAQEVDRLDDRKDQLMDPEQLELIAREEYGLVKPGEIPYVVVTPEHDPQLRAEQPTPEVADKPWYRRFWAALSALWD